MRKVDLTVAILTIGYALLSRADQKPDTKIWPQWRGPSRDGRVTSQKWPDKLDADCLEKSWQIELGPSYSGPIVSTNLVFTTETKGKMFEAAIAFDRDTGEQVWRTQWKGSIRVPFFAASGGSWIRATPAYDGEHLFVAGMQDVLVCLDAQSGREKWRVDFVDKFKTSLPSFGFVSSPLLEGDAIYVQAGASVVKLAKHSGNVIWRTLEDADGMMSSAFSSPIIAELAGTRQLLVQTRKALAGVDMQTGRVLWSKAIPAFRGMNILTPVVIGDSLFTSTYRNKSWLLDVSVRGGQYHIDENWQNNVRGYMSTPVVIGGYIYMHLQNQKFTCVDLKTGESMWSSQRFGEYWSLVSNDNRILALDCDGTLLLVDATPTAFRLIDSVKISKSETWGHLAVSGNGIFVRELNALTAYRWQDEENR